MNIRIFFEHKLSLLEIEIFIFFCFATIACSSNCHSVPCDIFKELQRNSKNTLTLGIIKNTKEDSLSCYLSLFESEFSSLFDRGIYAQKINKLLDESMIEKNLEIRHNVLLYAFHRYLNKEDLDFKEIENRVKKNIKKEQLNELIAERLRIESVLETVIYNDSAWKTGDTLNLYFQAKSSYNQIEIYYQGSGSEYSLLGPKYFAVANVQGILRSKKYRSETDNSLMPKEKFGIVFQTEVIHVGPLNAFYGDEKLLQGDLIFIPLWRYAKKIN